MKAITPVVSVILLIMLTIVASVGAYFFINTEVGELQDSGAIESSPYLDNSRLNLVSITGSQALVRNDGSSPVTEMVVLINGETLNYTLDTPIQPGEIREINYTSQLIGQDLEIKLIYNKGKTEKEVSPANQNTEISGFVLSLEPDDYESPCLSNNSNNVWFTGEANGTGYYCCGDDGELEIFNNGTDYCCNGSYNSGDCYCGNDICDSWENISSCFSDCAIPIINNVSITTFSYGLEGYCNATSINSSQILTYEYSWKKNDVLNISGVLFKKGSISAGRSLTCGIRANDSRVLCWGDNGYGQLGNGSLGGISTVPILTSDTNSYLIVSAGWFHACGVRSNGRVACWGWNRFGGAGTGTSGNSYSSPTLTNDANNYIKVSCGDYHSCGIRSDGRVTCWGWNGNNQIGDGTGTDATSPTLTTDTSVYTDIDTGDSNSCGIRANDSRVLCWGYNGNGQLGTGDTTQMANPTLTTDTTPYKMISTGSYFTCGVNINGKVLCTGLNTNGQLGVGDTTNRNQFTQINDTGTYLSVSSGTTHSCAIRNDSRLLCWGSNTNGQLGTGDNTQRTSPILSSDSSNYFEINSGWTYTCGIISTGKVKCFGWGASGKLGNGDIIDISNPTDTNDYSQYSVINYYLNKNLLVDTLPISYTSSGETWTFSCRVKENHYSDWMSVDKII
jgi:flagellin-like protein